MKIKHHISDSGQPTAGQANPPDDAVKRGTSEALGPAGEAGLMSLLVIVLAVVLGTGLYLVWAQTRAVRARLDRIEQQRGPSSASVTGSQPALRRLELEQAAVLATVQDLEGSVNGLAESERVRTENDKILRQSLTEFGDYVDTRLSASEKELSQLRADVAALKQAPATMSTAARTQTASTDQAQTYVFENGDVFVGRYENGKKEGFGTYTFHTGEKYTGTYKNGQRHGHGTFVYRNGDTYDGEFEHGKRHGNGTYTYARGGKYIGSFKENMRDGDGCYVGPNGAKTEGVWKANKFVGKQ